MPNTAPTERPPSHNTEAAPRSMILPVKVGVALGCRRLAKLLQLPSLPARLDGRWVPVPTQYWTGPRLSYEPHTARQFVSRLQPGDTFWDIGAHHGIWSSLASNLVSSAGRVVAFEPSDAFRLLERSLGRRGNVALREEAVGSECGQATFHGQGTDATGSLSREVTALNEDLHPAEVTSYTVPVTTLDTTLEAEGRAPDLVKIDVEGFELHVLRGGMRLLEEEKPEFIIEIHPTQMELCDTTPDELIALLERVGYTTEVIDRNPNSIYTIAATPKAK